jgi:hypothetical protein
LVPLTGENACSASLLEAGSHAADSSEQVDEGETGGSVLRARLNDFPRGGRDHGGTLGYVEAISQIPRHT